MGTCQGTPLPVGDPGRYVKDGNKVGMMPDSRIITPDISSFPGPIEKITYFRSELSPDMNQLTSLTAKGTTYNFTGDSPQTDVIEVSNIKDISIGFKKYESTGGDTYLFESLTVKNDSSEHTVHMFMIPPELRLFIGDCPLDENIVTRYTSEPTKYLSIPTNNISNTTIYTHPLGRGDHMITGMTFVVNDMNRITEPGFTGKKINYFMILIILIIIVIVCYVLYVKFIKKSSYDEVNT